jgi:hypothetical protein
MGLKLVFTRREKKPVYPAREIVAREIPGSYYDKFTEVATKLPDHISVDKFNKALKVAENVYYNSELGFNISPSS